MAGPEPRLVLSVAAMTDTGKTRGHNEDYVAYHMPSEPQSLEAEGALFLVCDGVGGGAAGEVASEHAAGRILRDYFQPGNGSDQQAKLIAAIQHANSEIYAENARSGDDRKMATTVVAALVIGNQLSLAHAGDSRAYLVRAGHISQLTRDHSWVAEMVESGDLTEADAENHPWRNRITRSLGVSETVKLDTQSLPLQADDVLVLCSDGLTRHVKDVEIGTAASQNPPAVAAEQLIQLANSRGGSDNITALVVRLQPEDLAPTERVLMPPPMPLTAPTLLSTAPALAPAPVVAGEHRRPWVLYAAIAGTIALVALLAVAAVALRWFRADSATATPAPAGTATVAVAVPSAAPSMAPTATTVASVPEPAASATADALASLLATATAAAITPPAPLATATIQVQGEVIWSVVVLRLEHSASSQPVASLDAGTLFTVLGWSQQAGSKCRTGLWLRALVDDGSEGWVCGDDDLVSVNGQAASKDYLEQLGIPALPDTSEPPQPTATKGLTEAPAPAIVVSFSPSLPALQIEPLNLPALALPDMSLPMCVDIGVEPLDLEPLVLAPLPTLNASGIVAFSTPEAGCAGFYWPG